MCWACLLSAVREVAEWNASRAWPTCFSGQPRRGDRKCHLLSQTSPRLGGPERSQHSPGRETKACGGSSHDTGARRLAQTCHCVPTSLERTLWTSAILASVRDFSKLHKDALGPDTAPGHRVVSSRPEGWGPWMGF